MGAQRHGEDPHPRPGPNPKLTLAGRLDGFVNGRPVTMLAEGRNITLVTGVRTLFALRRLWRSTVAPLRTALAVPNLRLLVRVGWFVTVELLPDPPLLARLALPRTG